MTRPHFYKGEEGERGISSQGPYNPLRNTVLWLAIPSPCVSIRNPPRVNQYNIDMNSYYVYLLASRSRVLYVGVNNDIYRRVLEHKLKQNPGFTSKYNGNRLVYLEETSDILAALEREKEIKAWRREKKVALIEADNPRWDDL
jgi:putative endonuclease